MTAEATFSYPGITDYVEARYTLSHGVSPGRIIVRTPPDAARPAAGGTATFRCGGNTIAMPGCRIDSVTAETDPSGRTMLRFEILDCRWAWKLGAISGLYNRPAPDGRSIDRETEKTPRELAQLCFEAMGLRDFDLSNMPQLLRPAIDWDYQTPALALADLADTCGCRVVLKIGGRVAIEPVGAGAPLPTLSAAIGGRAVYDLPDAPPALRFAAGPSQYQCDFELAPVALEPNGDIVPLDEASYAPPRGWKHEPLPQLGNVDARYRKLAQSCVWKYYQIQPGFYLPGEPRRPENKIEKIEEVLPLLATQIEADRMPDQTLRRRPPWAYGLFERGESAFPLRDEKLRPDPNLNDVPQDLYARGMRIDRRQGLVIFDDPVFLYRQTATTYETHPARMRLRIACQRRDKRTRGVVRYEVTTEKKVRRGAAQTILRDDISRQAYWNFKTRKLVVNQEEVDRQARHYLQAARQAYQASQPATLTYDGFWPIQPDGAIQQVSWGIDRGGKGSTVVSRNREDELIDVSYRERRLMERMIEFTRNDRRRGRQGETE
ncbi:MAG: hypothetical protein ACIALR_11425 [Blastopirellula sp. JB062]